MAVDGSASLEILRCTQDDIVGVVILNEVKNLEVSVAVDRSASLEILRCTQDDIESVRLPRLVPSLAMTVDSINLAMTMYSVWPARISFVALRMTQRA